MKNPMFVKLPYGVSSVNVETFNLYYGKLRVRVNNNTPIPQFSGIQVRSKQASDRVYLHLRWITSDLKTHDTNRTEAFTFIKSIMHQRINERYMWIEGSESAMDKWFDEQKKQDEVEQFYKDYMNDAFETLAAE